ncbi:hypothetical protein T03_12419 [Trichinella britovi]|uniref:Major sperm protein n=1 Tax=Trichinella britovi TaxID=45882 RepID=A0A0V1CKW6_TRIBR|nr:hypothetical protein T03_3313 [Trichinella britovi]KRY49364.1 hypothetical protein T03_12419 [Trichinella britovi]
MEDEETILSEISVSLCCVKLTPSYNDTRCIDVAISNPTSWKISYKIHSTRKNMLYIKPPYAFIDPCTTVNVTLILETVSKEGFDCTVDHVSIYFAVVPEKWMVNPAILFWKGKEPPKITSRHIISVSYEQTVVGECVEKQSEISKFVEKMPCSESAVDQLFGDSSTAELVDDIIKGELCKIDNSKRLKTESGQVVNLNNNEATNRQDFQEKETPQHEFQKRAKEEKSNIITEHEKEKMVAGNESGISKAAEQIKENTPDSATPKENNASSGERQKENQVINSAVSKALSSDNKENDTDKHNPDI